MPMDPVWSTKCFLDSSCIKNGFYIFDWLKKIKRIFHDTWKLCKIKISVSINKALLKHSHTHSFMILFWLLSCFKGRVEYLWQSLDGPLWVNYFLSSPCLEEDVHQDVRVYLTISGSLNIKFIFSLFVIMYTINMHGSIISALFHFSLCIDDF